MTIKNDPEILAAARKGAFGSPKTVDPKDLSNLVGLKVYLDDGTCVGTVVDYCTGSVTVDTTQ